MRVAVTGATGNLGTSLVRALMAAPEIDEVVAVARRRPGLTQAGVRFVAADVGRSPLAPAFEGADAVVHLAWQIQPMRDRAELERTNVEGSARVFNAAGAAGVGTLIHASSVGAYSPAPKDERLDESWPTDGIPSSTYSRQKAEAERLLDRFSAQFPGVRTVRLRPALVFKRDAASEIKRYFAGPLLPRRLVRRGLVPFVPSTERLTFQAVHADDVAQAVRLALLDDGASGAFNLASEPVLGGQSLARILGARAVKVPEGALRAAADVSFRLRLQPTEAGWVDIALNVPVMDTARARDVLGWKASRSADSALAELLEGIRDGAGGPTPPLAALAGPL